MKACLRRERVFAVIEYLEQAGARDMTVINVEAIGRLADLLANEHRLVRKYREKYSAVTKIEIVCRDDEAARFAEIIRQSAHTGATGDGRIFISGD